MKKIYVILSLLLVAFLVTTLLVFTNNTESFDNLFYSYLISFRNDFWDIFFKTITNFANTVPVICFIIIILMLISNEYRNVFGITVIVTLLTNNILKHIFMRPRPIHEHLINQGGYSYPSGHTMISVAIYGFLIYYVFKTNNNKKTKVLLISLLSLLIVLIGLSRVYLGVHYPSDIIAGYSLALFLIILIITFLTRGNNNDKISS